MCTTPPTVFAYCIDTLQMFSHGLKMCICFGYNPQIFFKYFFSQIECIGFLAIYYYQDMNVLGIKFSD